MSLTPYWSDPLYAAVQGRLRPEDVAKTALRILPELPHEKLWKKRAMGRSYMGTEFESPSPLTDSANVLALFLDRPILNDEQTFGPEL
ncbi:hypothetical protein EON81_29995, partial [bacterium]